MIIVLLIGILIVMTVCKLLYQRLWAKELSVELAFHQPYVYAGEWTQLSEKIENRKRFPVSPVEVRFRMKKGIQFREAENTSISDCVYKRDIYSLVGNQRITRTLHLECMKRGLYTIEDVTLVTYPLLQKKIYEKAQPTDAQIYVYAKRTDVSAILRTCESLLGDRESNRKYLEDPFAFASIREYTMQDPMKNINWKASAKTGGLMVNTYTSMQNERMMIYLDIEDRGILKKEHLKEDSISVAATLFQKLLNKGTEVGICVNLYDEEKKDVLYLPPSRKKSQRTRLEQILADDWQDERIADMEKMFEYPLGDAIPVMISKNITEQRVRRIEEFIGSKSRGIWVVPYEKGECPDVHSEQFTFVKREVDR